MTFRSYYTPPYDGRRILNPNQTAILILINSKKMNVGDINGSTTKFRMLETQIATISGLIFSSDERWALIEAMNELGWQVAICRDYWTFIQTRIIETWPILDNIQVLELVTIVSRTQKDKQLGPLSEKFESFDITELSKFYYNTKEIRDAVKATIEERLWEEHSNNSKYTWDEELEKIQNSINLINVKSDNLNEHLRIDEFNIWEYLYYDLYKSNIILDVFKLKAK